MRIGALVSLAILVASAGCGSSGNSAAPNAPASTGDDAGASTTTGDDDSADAGAADAKPDPHDVYPASHPPIPVIHNLGGRVIANPKMITVTFAGMDTTLRDYIRDFASKIGATDYWKTALDGYGVGPATAADAIELPDAFSNVDMTDGDVQTWIATQVANHTLPAPDENTIYMLYVSANAKISIGGGLSPVATTCQGYGGYHSSGVLPSDQDGGVGTTYLYAINAECESLFQGTAQQIMDGLTVTASHELAEAATDPDVGIPKYTYLMQNNDAWAPDARGGEVGDLCENIAATRQGTWAVQRIWNAAAAKLSHAPCQPAPSPVYYGAVPHTVVPGQKFGGAPQSDGYIIAKKGATADIEVDVFSTAALPSPLTLATGKGRFGGAGTDPSVSTTVLKGVTMTFSQPTGTNGDKVTLHVAVDPTVASGTTKFVIRSVLSTTDYNTWPVLLYIP